MIPLTIILIALAMFDTWYTYYLFDKGFTEANPVMKWLMDKLQPLWVYLSTALFWIIMSWWLWFTMRGTYYYVAIGIAIFIHGAVILHNYNLTRSKK